MGVNINSVYQRAYERLEKLKLESGRKQRISAIIFYSEKYGRELPEVDDLARSAISDLDAIIRKYDKRSKRDHKRALDSVIAFH